MAVEGRRSAGPQFGDGGGTNVTDYLELLDGGHEAEDPRNGHERIVDVRMDRIDRSPYQVRVDFDAGELEALGEDIETNGLHHPVTLRAKRDGRYELLAGERRWLAVQALGR
ncbi:MAG: ParB/RepB/Spo0J family partition protein, partial [Longimicrobiales bacterium]